MAVDDENFDLYVVDQSENITSAEKVASFQSDERFHYQRMKQKGLAAARNFGIRQSSGDIIAMTDDDCEVPRDWLSQIRRVFQQHPQIGMVFGNVREGPFDKSKGFIPAYCRNESFVARSVRDKNEVEGIGACMAVRRSLWISLGGFDELLGAGGRFRAGEENDFALRALQSGHYVLETPNAHVTHHGFRTWEEGRKLIPSYWYGTGAMFAKHLKLNPTAIIPILSQLGWRWLRRPSRFSTTLGGAATRTKKLVPFIKGFTAGLRIPADRATNCFAIEKPSLHELNGHIVPKTKTMTPSAK